MNQVDTHMHIHVRMHAHTRTDFAVSTLSKRMSLQNQVSVSGLLTANHSVTHQNTNELRIWYACIVES